MVSKRACVFRLVAAAARDFHPGVIGSVETSAKDHTHAGIAEAVAVLVHSIISKGHAPPPAETQGVVSLKAEPNKTKGCC